MAGKDRVVDMGSSSDTEDYGDLEGGHSVLICHSSVTQSFFLFFTFFMTSIAFKVHINDN